MYGYGYKQFTFQHALQSDIMWLQDTGILERLKYDIAMPPIIIPRPVARHNEPLNISQMAITMILLLSGLVISILVFLFEVLNNRGAKAL